MNHMNNLLNKVAMILLAVGFISVGLIAIWVALITSVVASAVFLFDSGRKWFQQPHIIRLDGRRNRSPECRSKKPAMLKWKLPGLIRSTNSGIEQS